MQPMIKSGLEYVTDKEEKKPKIKILILSNHAFMFYKFRKEFIECLVRQGWSVYFSVPYGDKVEQLKALGIDLINTPIDRRGMNPITDFKLLLHYYRIINKIKPHVVLTYTIKPNTYGGLLCRLKNIPYIANVTGLGSAINSAGIIKKLILLLYRMSLNKASCVFFQNQMNMRFFLDNRIITANSRLIPGSGVNLTYHCLEEYPTDETIKFLFIGRIMKEKGIEEYSEAAKIIKAKYPYTEFNIIGFCEEDYEEELRKLQDRNIVKYHGLQDDAHSFIKSCHAIILPSYHEGMANVLLEAASSGRPVIASNIPGCKETFDDGISGFGIEIKNIDDLVNKLEIFIALPYTQKKQMGLAGRAKMEREFNRQIVIDSYMGEIGKIIKGESHYSRSLGSS